MSNSKMLIDAAHPEETRVVVLKGNRVEEFDFESASKKQLRGNIYLAKVTRVEPSLQAAFVEYGGNRHGFLAFSEIHPDYYQIPFADRQALLEEEARAHRDEDDEGRDGRGQSESRGQGENRGGGESRSGGDGRSQGDNRRNGRRGEGRGNGENRSQGESGEQSARGEGRGERNGRGGDRNERGQRRSRRHRRDGAPASALERRDAGDDSISEVAFDADAVAVTASDDAATGGHHDTTEPTSFDPAADAPDSRDAGVLATEDRASELRPSEVEASDVDMAEHRDLDADAPRAEAAGGDDAGEPVAAQHVAAALDLDAVSASAAEDGDAGATEPTASTEDAHHGSLQADADAQVSAVVETTSEPSATDRDASVAESWGDETGTIAAFEADASGDSLAAPALSSPATADDEPLAGEIVQGEAVEARDTREHQDDEHHGADHEEEHVEQIGGDALSDVAPRPVRLRRHYKIQEVIKRRQILLIQVVKEERGNKGAALTTYLSLAGRYSVLMPNTAKGGGISRKITDGEDRKRLKAIAQELDVPEGMGVILRTAGASRSPVEVRRDFEYLLRMWESVRELTLKSSAPSLVYEEGSLIKRSIRDLYSKEVEEIVVSGEEGFTEARDFMRMLMPGNVKSVQLYRDPQPIFAKSGVEAQLDAMFSPHVTLKSGGYLVINQTEALVAIDVNSGRSTREHNIEDTALRTNLEAADEVARQLRLRDLAGLIVVDFIDMEEGRNNRAVERRIKEALKNDRARIQIGRISHFGLLEMSRQRIRTGVLEGSTVVCPHCAGAGTVRSTASIALHVLRLVEDALLKEATYDLVVRSRAEVALYMLNQKRAKLVELEQRFGVGITVAADPSLTGMVYHAIERGELAQAPLAPAPRQDLVRVDSIAPIFEPGSEAGDDAYEAEAARDGESEAEVETEALDAGAPEGGEGEGDGRRRKRRRRRRGRDRDGGGETASEASQSSDDGDAAPEGGEGEDDAAPATAPEFDAPGFAAGSLDPVAGASDPATRDLGFAAETAESGTALPDDGADALVPVTASVPIAAQPVAAEADVEPVESEPAETVAEEAPKRRRSRRTAARIAQEGEEAAVAEAAPEAKAPARPRRRRAAARPRAGSEAAAEAATESVAEPAPDEVLPAADVPAPEARAAEPVSPTRDEPVSDGPVGDAPALAEANPAQAPVQAPAAADPEAHDPDRPKRSGWWQRAKASFGS